MKIKSILKKTSVAMAAFSCLLASSMTANAAWDYVGVKSERYYYYNIYRDTTHWIVFHHNLDACNPIYHVKWSGDKHLNFQRDVTYTRESSKSFSASITGGGSGDIVEAAVTIGGEVSWTTSKSWTKSGSVGHDISSDAPSGYYKMTICHNFHKYWVTKCNNSDHLMVNSEYPCIAYGEAYVATLYNPNNTTSSGWRIYGT